MRPLRSRLRATATHGWMRSSTPLASSPNSSCGSGPPLAKERLPSVGMSPPADGPIDLRSDTVTRPTAAMRSAIAAAPVGDDQYGEDPTVNALQERVATLLGKEAALFLPSGTMANQVALRVLTRPGDDVIVSRESHMVWHETGAGAANAGVQFTEVGARGVFSAAQFSAACKPRGHVVYPPTSLVAIENTHNRSGGGIFPHATA